MKSALSTTLSAFTVAALLLGCASRSASDVPVAIQALEPPQVVAITGLLLRESVLFGDANSASTLCRVRAGSLAIQRFQAGRYRVALKATARCDAGNAASGWIDASDIDFTDEDFAPFLKRVTERPNLRIEMAYAGNKIFCDGNGCKVNEPLYGKARCYAAPAVADALVKAADALTKSDPTARLLVLDCYRPIDVQIEMFKRVADPVWVAQPKPPRYGGHNRGVAIDLTIEKNGKPLDMGSAFDAFSDVSNYDPKQVPAAAHANRTVLRELMLSNGFRPYDAEWWHFSLPVDTRAMNFPL